MLSVKSGCKITVFFPINQIFAEENVVIRLFFRTFAANCATRSRESNYLALSGGV
jgi:hypothetical protein